MSRFFHSRTGALLMLGFVVTALGIGWKQKPAVPFLAQTTQTGTCGNGRVETGEECEQSIDCPGVMTCQSCLCVKTNQCWSGQQYLNPYCNETADAPCNAAGAQCQDCICRDCSRCQMGLGNYGEFTSFYPNSGEPLPITKAVRMDETHVAVASTKGTGLGDGLRVELFEISGKHFVGTTQGKDVAVYPTDQLFNSDLGMVALDATHVVVLSTQQQPYPQPWKCVANVVTFPSTVGPPVELPTLLPIVPDTPQWRGCAGASIATLSPTKIVMIRGKDILVLGDVNLSNGQITLGTPIAHPGWTISLAKVDANRFAEVASENGCATPGTCSYVLRIGTVSGNTVDWGSPVSVGSFWYNLEALQKTGILFSDANKLLVINGAGELKEGSISGNAVSLGSPAFTPPASFGLAAASAVNDVLFTVGTTGIWRCTGTSCAQTDRTSYVQENTIRGDDIALPIAMGQSKWVFVLKVRHTSGAPGQPGGGQVWENLGLQIGEITCPACSVRCGDGRSDAGEQCGEPGLAACSDASTACQHCLCSLKRYGTVCGDGYQSYPEQCDWGAANFVSGAMYYNSGFGNGVPMYLTKGDFDGDGKVDIAAGETASTYGQSDVFISLNKNNFLSWQPSGMPVPQENKWPAGESPREVVAGDFDRDGKLDVVATNDTRSFLTLTRGKGDGTYLSSSRIFGGMLTSQYTANRNLVTADFNQDAYPDIAFSYGLNKTAVALTQAGGTFAPPIVALDQGVQHLATAVGDFDRDAKPDLAILRTVGAGTVVSILKGNGNGSFQSPQDYSIENSNARGGPMAVADLNADGYDDIVVQPALSKRATVMINNRNGSFTLQTSPNGILNATNFCLADYNLDGKKDLIAGEHESNIVPVYFGQANGNFSAVPDRFLKFQYFVTRLLCEDVDGDGKLDFFAAHGAPQGPVDQTYKQYHDQITNGHNQGVSMCPSKQGGCELRNPCASGTCNGVTCMCDGAAASTPSSSRSSSSSSVVSSSLGSSSNPPSSSNSAPSSVASSVVSSLASSSVVSSSRSSSVSSTAVSSSRSSSALFSSSPSVAASSTSSIAQSSSISSVVAAVSSSLASSAPSSAYTSSVAHSSSSSATSHVSSASSLAAQQSSSSAGNHMSSSTAQYSSILIADESPFPTSRCGNSILETGEACDTGIPCANGGFCTAQCQCKSADASSRSEEVSASARCGDGILSPGEGCDSGIPCPNNGFCTASCVCQDRGTMTLLCGNGVLNVREECDDGNAQNGDGCDAHCRREVTMQAQECGNAFLEGNEQCETTVSCPRPGDVCRNCQCYVPSGTVCGNGILEFPEECETTSPCPNSTYICSRCSCLAPVCGDGNKSSGEECDDGNTVNGDGCSDTCQREIPNLIAAQQLCGNGIVETGEQCDDGNSIDRDGCSAACSIEIFPSTTNAAADALRLSLLADRPVVAPVMTSSAPVFIPALIRTGPTPKKAPSLPSSIPSTGVRPQMRPAATDPQVPFPAPAYYPPVTATVTQQTTAQYPAYWQPYGSVVPYAPASGPVGKTGPASLAIMVGGAAAGMTWMRRKRTTLPTLRKKS